MWGHLTGKLSTPANYEAHRLELAQKIWAELKANDSAECRSCHTASAMALGEAAADGRRGARLAGDERDDLHRLPQRRCAHAAAGQLKGQSMPSRKIARILVAIADPAAGTEPRASGARARWRMRRVRASSCSMPSPRPCPWGPRMLRRSNSSVSRPSKTAARSSGWRTVYGAKKSSSRRPCRPATPRMRPFCVRRGSAKADLVIIEARKHRRVRALAAHPDRFRAHPPLPGSAADRQRPSGLAPPAHLGGARSLSCQRQAEQARR